MSDKRDLLIHYDEENQKFIFYMLEASDTDALRAMNRLQVVRRRGVGNSATQRSIWQLSRLGFDATRRSETRQITVNHRHIPDETTRPWTPAFAGATKNTRPAKQASRRSNATAPLRQGRIRTTCCCRSRDANPDKQDRARHPDAR